MTTFAKWIQSQPRGTLVSLERSGVAGHTTLAMLRNGGLISDYALAKRISDATGGVVSVRDLCEPAEAPRKRRRS